MNQKSSEKTITIALKPEWFKSRIDTTKKPPGNKDDKYKMAREIIDLPVNFSDDFDVVYDKDQILFKWQPQKIDAEAESLHKNALALARKGNLDEAISKWAEATRLNPSDPDYFFNLGIACFEKKSYQDSVDNLTRVIAICPFYVKAHLILGTALLKLRKFEFAKNHFIKSIKFNKSNALSFLNLGAVHSILKEYDDGIAMFQEAIKLAPKEPRAYLGLAKIYATVGDSKKANTFFKKVIELDNKGNLANYAKKCIVANGSKNLSSQDMADIKKMSGNPEDFYSEGYRQYISGNYEKAEMMYKKYLSIKQDDDFVWFALGEAQLRSGDPESALESFKKAIKIYPRKALYLKELAIVFDKLNKPDKVIAAISKAKEYGKTDSIGYSLWGKALFQQGNYEEAVMILEQAIKSNQNNFLAKYYIAEALLKLDDVDSALDYLYDLKEVKINTPLKERARQLFTKLTEKE